jgi:phospholipase/lecithinase/hemolysin
MRQIKFTSVLLMVLALVGCGGGGGGNQAPKVLFSAQVSFGDSLSDVGTYKVGAVAAAGGGEFTINGAGKNWTELMAAQLGLPPPCAAETGLSGTLAVSAVFNTTCTGYAQGGARVTSQPGIGNAALGGVFLTVPVATQIANHLATLPGGKFSGHEIVFVLAGANDVFYQLGAVGAGLPAASAVAYVGQAASDLVNDINTMTNTSGAKYVTVVNVPDINTTPYAATLSAPVQGLLSTMVTTFNGQLQSGLAGNPNVLLVDAYSVSHDQSVNPAPYGLTNVTTPACNLANPPNFLGSSLVCNTTNLIPGVVDHYQFADTVHPTPFGYLLLARYVSRAMIIRGWL